MKESILKLTANDKASIHSVIFWHRKNTGERGFACVRPLYIKSSSIAELCRIKTLYSQEVKRQIVLVTRKISYSQIYFFTFLLKTLGNSKFGKLKHFGFCSTNDSKIQDTG